MGLMEQLMQNEKNEDAAKAIYLKGTTDPFTISETLGCPVQHVLNWIENGKWEKLKK